MYELAFGLHDACLARHYTNGERWAGWDTRWSRNTLDQSNSFLCTMYI